MVHGGVPALTGEGCARKEGQHGLWQGVASQERGWFGGEFEMERKID